MYCKHCGAQNVDGSTFCANCGQSLTDEVVEQKPAQPAVEQTAAPVEEGPTGLKKILYIVGAVCSFVAIVLLFGLFFGSGIVGKEAGLEHTLFTTAGFFSAKGVWNTITTSIQSKNISDIIGLLFAAILTLITIIILLVYFIIGIIKFVKAMNGDDYRGVTKTAIKMYGIFAAMEFTILSLFSSVAAGPNVADTGLEDIFGGDIGLGGAELGLPAHLNAVAVAAICLGAILIGATLVLRFIANLKSNLGLKKLLNHGTNLLVVAIGFIVAALAAGPVLKLDHVGDKFFQTFLPSVISGIVGSKKPYIYSAIGWVATILLISFGVSLIKGMLLKIYDEIEGKPHKKSGFAYAVACFIAALALVVVCYLYGKEKQQSVDGVLPIVIMVFSFVASVVILLRNKLLEK